jgi:hypothetical protein
VPATNRGVFVSNRRQYCQAILSIYSVFFRTPGHNGKLAISFLPAKVDDVRVNHQLSEVQQESQQLLQY